MSISSIFAKFVDPSTLLMEIYPRPLKSLILETKRDETFFTELEKKALKSAWYTIQRQANQLSRNLFVDFFSRNDQMIEYFRLKSGKINVKALAQHPSWMMNIFGKFVMVGLQSNGHIESVLHEFVTCHFLHRVPQSDLGLILIAMKEHYLSAIAAVVTPTLTNAFEKLCNIIYCAHEESRRRTSLLPGNIDIQYR